MAADRRYPRADAGRGGGDPLSGEAFALLREMRDAVPQAVRAEAAAAIVGRRVHPAIVALIAEEKPAIAAAVIGQARLADDEWLALLPRLSPVARSLLRHRRDLSPAVLAGLGSFGTSDFGLPSAAVEVAAPALTLVEPEAHAVPGPAVLASAEPEPAEPGVGDTQIRDLLARIAAYRDGDPLPPPAPQEPPAPIESFRFETGAGRPDHLGRGRAARRA